MAWRWPWSTKEDDLIRILDQAIAASDADRQEARRLTLAVRREAERKLKEQRRDEP